MDLSKEELEGLREIIKAHKSGQQEVFRAQIISMLGAEYTISEIARQLETTRKTVKLWRKHWEQRQDVEIRQRLSDEARPGAPATITAQQWCQIMAIACSSPQESGRPISHWTAREIADEAIKRGIVTSISPRHVGRFLKSGRITTPQKLILAQ